MSIQIREYTCTKISPFVAALEARGDLKMKTQAREQKTE
jgi:hypothetical protein